MSFDIVTPDGITEKGKDLIHQKLGGKYSPEDISLIISLIDSESRKAMFDRSGSTKIADAFKRSLPLLDSTSEKMSNALTELFKKTIPEDISSLKVAILEITKNK